MDSLLYLGKIPGTPGTAGQHRNLENILKKREIDLYSLFSGFIAEIDNKNQGSPVVPYIVQRQNLLQKMKPPLHTGGITDHHDKLRFPAAQKIPGDLFLLRVGSQ